MPKSKAYLKNLRRKHHLGEFSKKKNNPCKRPKKFKSEKQRKSFHASGFKKAKDNSFF